MTWALACDASYSMPDPAALKAAGYAVVMGYLSDTPGKGITAAYVAKCAAAGILIQPLYETTATMALGGRSAGVAAATEATAIGRELGCPADVAIMYALDSDYSTAEMAGPVSAFVEGLHAVAGPDGEYGGYDQLAYLVAHNTDVGRLFQSYAWSSGRWLPAAQAPIEQYRNGVQLAGGTVDLCRIDLSVLTLWDPRGPIMTTPTPTEIVADVWGLTAAKGANPADVIRNPRQRSDSPLHTPPGTNPTTGAGFALGDIWQVLYDIRDAVRALPPPAVIAAAVLAELPAPATGGLTEIDVETAVHAALGKLGIAVTVAP